MNARQELMKLASEHGWEVGAFPWHAGVDKTGFVRGNVQIRVNWTDAGNVEQVQRVATGQVQIILDRTDRNKRAEIAAWLTDRDVR